MVQKAEIRAGCWSLKSGNREAKVWMVVCWPCSERTSVVTAQARLLRCRYPMAGPFTAGRRARSGAACGLAPIPERSPIGQAGAVRTNTGIPGRVEGACEASGQCWLSRTLLARPDGTDRTMLAHISAVGRCAIR